MKDMVENIAWTSSAEWGRLNLMDHQVSGSEVHHGIWCFVSSWNSIQDVGISFPLLAPTSMILTIDKEFGGCVFPLKQDFLESDYDGYWAMVLELMDPAIDLCKTRLCWECLRDVELEGADSWRHWRGGKGLELLGWSCCINGNIWQKSRGSRWWARLLILDVGNALILCGGKLDCHGFDWDWRRMRFYFP